MRPAGRRAWCPTCREVDMADGEWRCCWCGARTLRGKARVAAIPHRSSMTTRIIVEAHRMHAEGLPLAEVVEAIFDRTGYTSRPHCMNALRQAFVAMGLPTRSDADSKALEAWRGTWSGPRFYRRPDVKDDLLIELYREHRTTSAVARLVPLAQQTVYQRLRKLGIITPRQRQGVAAS